MTAGETNSGHGVLLTVLVLLTLLIPVGVIAEPLSPDAPSAGNGGFTPLFFENGKLVIYYFFNHNCGECLRTIPFMVEYQQAHPDITVRYLDIREDPDAFALFQVFKEYYGVGFAPVPTVFVGNHSLSGYDDITNGLDAAVKGTTGEGPQPDLPGTDGVSGSTLTIPLVIAAALVDGINPCAFAVLIFLMLSLMSLDSRKRMLMVGAVFISAVFLFYFFSGLGLFSVIQFAGISRLISLVAAVIALAAGAISILSVVRGEQGPALLSIPESKKGIIDKYIQKGSLPAAFIVGVLVGMFELPCTGGIYLAILALLSNQMTLTAGVPYLLVYNFFFILPLIILLAVFAFGLPVERLDQWRTGSRRGIRLIMGAVMILLGIILLFEVLI
jgi:cytochrome c biogenesis protein CcdA